MERALERLLYLGQAGKKVHVIFESRGKVEDLSLEKEFRRIADNQGNWGWRQPNFRKMEWEPMIVPKTVNSSGLQLADLSARPIGLHVLRPQQANRAYEILRPKIRAEKCFP
jgi:hypothetical protein